MRFGLNGLVTLLGLIDSELLPLGLEHGVQVVNAARVIEQERARGRASFHHAGLTESLEVGYRLSPRGESLLRELSER